MAGHNKWSKVKHKKARTDAKKSKIFTKINREITVAAREGGGDADFNPRLRLAIDKANAANMPKDNIENAIKKGTGELEGVEYTEYTYEGYGPEGCAFFIEALSDNKNRTVSEVRHLFSKHGGNLGTDGSVAWQFERVGQIVLEARSVPDTDAFELAAIEAGASELDRELSEEEGDEQGWVVYTAYEDLARVDEALRRAGYAIAESELIWRPTSTVRLEEEEAIERVVAFYEALDENDDVQSVYANFEID